MKEKVSESTAVVFFVEVFRETVQQVEKHLNFFFSWLALSNICGYIFGIYFLLKQNRFQYFVFDLSLWYFNIYSYILFNLYISYFLNATTNILLNRRRKPSSWWRISTFLTFFLLSFSMSRERNPKSSSVEKDFQPK